MPQLAAGGSDQPGVGIDWAENPSILLGFSRATNGAGSRFGADHSSPWYSLVGKLFYV